MSSWMTDEHQMLADMTAQFINKEWAPAFRPLAQAGRDGPRDLAAGGRAGSALPLDPRGIRRRRRRFRPRGRDPASKQARANLAQLGQPDPFRHRRALHPRLRHRGSEKTLAAQNGLGRDGRRAGDDRTVGRIGRAGRSRPRPCGTATPIACRARRPSSPTASTPI